MGAEGVEPGGGAIADVPGVEAVGGEETDGLRAESGELRDGDGVGGAKGGDGGPVGFLGAVDDRVGDAGVGEVGKDLGEVGRERGGREVVVGVEEHQATEGEGLTTKHPNYTKVGFGFGPTELTEHTEPGRRRGQEMV